MKPSEWWSVVFVVQGCAIVVDEFYFHRRRGLPLWERIGHPADTVSVLLPLCLALLSAPTSSNIAIYVALSVLSCLLITKDEFVHQKLCSGAENWLHAILFIVHPLVLILAGLIWIEPSDHLVLALRIQVVLMALFLLYQIVYWSFLWRKSTTLSTKN